jgi:heme oxygenase
MRVAIIERLRRETADAHARTERHFAMLLGDAPTRVDYVRFLSAMWSFHAGIEPALDRVIGWASRRKVPAIEHDLRALGEAIPHRTCAPPPLPDLDSALGAAYVVEGSTLGARVLHRHLVPRLGLEEARFLSAYGERTIPMWRAFASELAAREGDADRIVAAAVDTFLALERFLVDQRESRLEITPASVSRS